jgi:hypothetical protein
MKNRHLSDTDLQQYAWDPSNCDRGIVVHLELCGECMDKAMAYRLLFSEIKQEPKPAFDFDLSERVLSRIPVAEPKRSPGISPLWLLVLAVPAAIGIPFILFGKGLFTIFSGLPVMGLCLLATIPITILLFQGIEAYQKYQQKMDALNLY